MSDGKKKVPFLKIKPQDLKILHSFTNAIKARTALGQLQGPSLGFAALQEWCSTNLPSSLEHCRLTCNGYFEARFFAIDGVVHALKKVYYMDGWEVLFAPWNDEFSSHDPTSLLLLQYPLCIQFLGIGIHWRNEECYRILGSAFGRVLKYDDNSSSRDARRDRESRFL